MSQKEGMKLKKRSSKEQNSPLSLDSNDYVIECEFSENITYRISLDLVEKLWKKALVNNKLPKLILGLRRNNKEVFVLNCYINLEKNKK